ncbi:TonB-dependent receptor domain-containing protein [Melioribacteraceae bacterium 4301-Me]|uniref:TonB-dependent receptor n=1 Tax=Pyranulibacter aquaticus TaxID=3163344 RepID=UPI00359BC71B
MKYCFIFFIIFSLEVSAQINFKISIRDSVTNEPLVGANIFVKNSNTGATTNLNGIALLKLPKGKSDLLISYIGYKAKEIEVQIGTSDSIKNVIVLLSPTSINLQQVTVTTSRINSFINDSPQRIEILGTEELHEKTIENPPNISEMLSELSAVQVVQTSSLSGATNFRILGLSGQYTQILKDGYPLFGGLSQDFALIQIPPLDLAQIEIIKGASSTFYGNGALTGILNLISKVPEEKSNTKFLFNITSFSGIDAGAFYSSPKAKTAFTLLTQYDYTPPKDLNRDGFTEISRLHKFNIEPKIFYQFNEKSNLKITASFLYDERLGGDIAAINSSPSPTHSFILKSASNRFSSGIDYQYLLDKENTIKIKSGISLFDLSINSMKTLFKGKQTLSFSEISYSNNSPKNKFTAGLSLATDNLTEDKYSTFSINNQSQSQIGLFFIDNIKLNDAINLEAGLRYEHINTMNDFLLPTAAAIYKPIKNFYVRFNYGTGYRIPSPISYLNEIEGTTTESTKIYKPTGEEYSKSYSLDCNYNFTFSNNFFLKLNQTFFAVKINNPYQKSLNDSNQYNLITQAAPLESYGTETNLRFGLEDVNFFVGLSYLKTVRKYYNNSLLPLTPKFKIVSILQIENENFWELDLGNIYMGSQYLDSGEKILPFATFEAMLKIKFGYFDFILNCENIFNFTQSDREPLVFPPYQDPRFAEIWGPIEGRKFNIALVFSK